MNRQFHILSAAYHSSGIAVADQHTLNKKSEIHFTRPLLDKVDITNKIITADALHTLKDFAEYIINRNADYLFIVKGNKKKLLERLKMLDVKYHAHSYQESSEKSHGRFENRTLWIMSRLPWWLWFKTAK